MILKSRSPSRMRRAVILTKTGKDKETTLWRRSDAPTRS